MAECLEIGMKLHAKYSDGTLYPAEVIAVSESKQRAKKPVKVRYLGYGSEHDAWLPLSALKSKVLPSASQPEGKAKAKAKAKTYSEKKTKKKTKVAIFGGAFDPPTMSHLLAAAEVIHTAMADQVWLVPCGPRPDKPDLSPGPKRLVMAQLAVNTFFSPKTPVYVAEYESQLAEGLSTYYSMCGFRQRHPDKEFSFIIGTDWLQDPETGIKKWTTKDPETGELVPTGEKLLAEFDALVVHRPGFDVKDLSVLSRRMIPLQMPEGTHLMSGNLSSTEVRKRSQVSMRARDSMDLIEGLVVPAVFNYINQSRLYYTKQPEVPEPPLLRRTLSPNSPGGTGKRVAVFGGAFDPPSNSHMLALAEIIHSGAVEEAMLVPCGPRPDKPNLSSPLTRYLMCQLAVSTTFSHKFPVRVSDLEVFEKESLATYDALSALRAREPNCRFCFVIGSDWLKPGSSLKDWTSRCPETGEQIVTGDRLLSEFDFIVLKRPGYEVEDLKAFGERMQWMEMPDGMKELGGNMSSTEVRRRVKNPVNEERRLIDGLVPQGVYNFITRYELYKE